VPVVTAAWPVPPSAAAAASLPDPALANQPVVTRRGGTWWLAVVDSALAAHLARPPAERPIRPGEPAPLAAAVACVQFRHCEVHRHFRNTVEVMTAFTQPEHRRRGWSRYLYQRVLDLCRRLGVATVQASVYSENAAAKALHRALGFRTTRQDCGYLEQLRYL